MLCFPISSDGTCTTLKLRLATDMNSSPMTLASVGPLTTPHLPPLVRITPTFSNLQHLCTRNTMSFLARRPQNLTRPLRSIRFSSNAAASTTTAYEHILTSTPRPGVGMSTPPFPFFNANLTPTSHSQPP